MVLFLKKFITQDQEPPDDKTYFGDQFHEIYNNSSEVLYADGLCIGVLQPSSSAESKWVNEDGSLMDKLPVTFQAWIIPGNGTEHPVNPGESIIIAQDGIDHPNDPAGNPNSPVDLSGADWGIIF